MKGNKTRAFGQSEVLLMIVLFTSMFAVGVSEMGVARAKAQAKVTCDMVAEVNKDIQKMVVDNESVQGISDLTSALRILCPRYMDRDTRDGLLQLVQEAPTWKPPVTFGITGVGTTAVRITTSADLPAKR